jgi:hypothetical protein
MFSVDMMTSFSSDHTHLKYREEINRRQARGNGNGKGAVGGGWSVAESRPRKRSVSRRVET